MKYFIAASLIALTAGCTSTADFSGEIPEDLPLLSGPQATADVRTPVADALECVADNRNRNQDLRIAIADIVDGTGARTNGDAGSPLLTQRPDLMFTVGLFRTGVRTLNRTTLRVAEWELGQAMDMRLGEGGPVEHEGDTFDFRPLPAGVLLGSTHYVTGALTEVNWNTNSSVTEGGLLGISAGTRIFSINVAADITVTDTRTTEIVFAESYQKTLVGREVSRGVFRFFDFTPGAKTQVELFDLSVTEQQNEPVHRAVRWLMELAAYDVAAEMTRTSRVCDPVLSPPPPPVVSVEPEQVLEVATPDGQGPVLVDEPA